MRFTASPLTAVRSLTVVGVIAVCALKTEPATAQTIDCARLENDAQRLACYDRAAAAPAAGTQERPVRQTQQAQPAAPAATTAPARQAAPPQTTTPSVATEPAREREAREAPETVPVVVASVRTTRGRGATFITDNGEVWKQSDSHSYRLPDAPFNATIAPGAVGSYFLTPENRRTAIRVHREE